jgi:hypothetical protein
VGNTTEGFIGTGTTITRSVGRGVAKLSMDRTFKQRRKDLQRPPRNGKEAVMRPLKDIGNGLYCGVTGLVKVPYSSVKRYGISGLPTGIAKGIAGEYLVPSTYYPALTSPLAILQNLYPSNCFHSESAMLSSIHICIMYNNILLYVSTILAINQPGLAAKPVVGVLDAVTHTGDAVRQRVKALIREKTEPAYRLRLSNLFGPDGRLLPYSFSRALGKTVKRIEIRIQYSIAV